MNSSSKRLFSRIGGHTTGWIVLLYAALLTTGDAQARLSVKRTIRVNEVLVPKTDKNYMEVRHIVLKGRNRGIGEALGRIAQDWLAIKPIVYQDPVYGKANRLYIEKNFPVLRRRIEGLGRAYQLGPNVYLGSMLLYDLWPMACSVIYFPGTRTTNGHPMVSRTLDFNPIRFSKAVPGILKKNDHKLYSRSFLLELYPTDGGYACMGIGSLDLLNGTMGGINEKGLVVSMLVDQQCPASPDQNALFESCGFTGPQLVQLVLTTCATVEEAKVALLQNRYIVTFRGLHFQIGDASGRVSICEIDPKTFLWRFTDRSDKIQVMTNHAEHLYPDPAQFPQASNPYNSFVRFSKLLDFVGRHPEPFSAQEAEEGMRLVYGNCTDERGQRVRTLWTERYDLKDKTLTAQFYLKDGAADEDGNVELVFSKPFTFRLAK